MYKYIYLYTCIHIYICIRVSIRKLSLCIGRTGTELRQEFESVFLFYKK